MVVSGGHPCILGDQQQIRLHKLCGELIKPHTLEASSFGVDFGSICSTLR